MSDSQVRVELADYARRLHARGWVANHDGNITVRLGPGRYLATPTAKSKADITADGLIIVDESGARIQGNGKPFSEIGLHLAVYRARPDIHAVVHAHPPTATGFAVAGVTLSRPIIPEAVVSLGVGVPTVPFAPPGPAATEMLGRFVDGYDAVLLENHGALSWGVDLEQAYLRMELVEHLAKITLTARQLGGERAIPDSAIPALLEARRKAGLARPAASSTPTAKPTVIACAPAPSDAPVTVRESKSAKPNPADLATIIRQEIANVLKPR